MHVARVHYRALDDKHVKYKHTHKILTHSTQNYAINKYKTIESTGSNELKPVLTG